MGPVLGGWLIGSVSWRLVFLINLPIALAVLGIVFWRVQESRDETASRRLDWWGALLVTVGLGGVVYGLTESANFGLTHPAVLAAIGLGAVALVLFGFVEARGSAPMMPLSLFQSRAFTGVNLLTFLLYASLSGALFFLPFDLIQVQGYSTTAAGAALLPFVLVMFAVSRWSGALVDRVGPRAPLVVGPVLAGVACGLYALPGVGGSYWATFFPAIAVHGLGMAIAVAPLTTVVLESVEARQAGLASGINNAVSRVAGMLAIALVGIVVLVAFNQSLEGRVNAIPLPPSAHEALEAQRSRLGAVEIPPGLSAEVAGDLRRAIDESFVAGFRLATLLAGALALAAAIVAVATIGGGRQTDPAVRAGFPPGG